MDAKLRSTFETLGRCSSGCRLGIVGSADCARARGLFFRRFPADASRPPAAAAQHQHAPRTTAAGSSSSSSSSRSSSSGIEKARLLPEGDFASDDDHQDDTDDCCQRHWDDCGHGGLVRKGFCAFGLFRLGLMVSRSRSG